MINNNNIRQRNENDEAATATLTKRQISGLLHKHWEHSSNGIKQANGTIPTNECHTFQMALLFVNSLSKMESK